MFKKVKKLFYNTLYSLPFGLKGANDEMFEQKSSSNVDGTAYYQHIYDNKLSKNLLKGEVSQEVEELRYRLYLVDRESQKYEYVGDGKAEKREITKFDENNFNIIQSNRFLVRNVNEEMNALLTNNRKIDEHTLNIIYESLPRFKLERYCVYFEVDVNKNAKHFIIRFVSIPNKDDISSYGFIKYLNSIIANVGKENDYSSLKMVKFVTFKCSGDDDLMEYELTNLKLKGVEYSNENKEYCITYDIGKLSRKDLTSKFYSKTMDEKYKNKDKKENMIDIANSSNLSHCAECGKVIDSYDSSITEETYGYPLCKECLSKTLKLKEEFYNLDKE